MKKVILGIVIGVIIGLSSTVIASSLIASQIGYTPKDNTWGVNNVEAAIDSLKLSKTSDNYSTDEKVVGTWIDGKPLYQKTFSVNIPITTNRWNDTGVTLSNVDVLVNYSAYGSDSVTEYNKILKPLNIGINSANNHVVFHPDTGTGVLNYFTLQYTKTTD